MNSNVNRRNHSHAIEIQKGIHSLQPVSIVQKNSKTWSESRFEQIFKWPSNMKRDEFPHSMGFILCSECWASQASVEMNFRTQWSSLNQTNQKFIRMWKHRCRSVLAIEMNSRVQWVSFSYIFSIPSPEWIPAPNGVHCRARLTTQPSLATQCRQMYPWEEMNSRVQWGSFSFNNVCSS